MDPLVKRIGRWYAALPSDKKYLLAYVRSTQELWTGTNYWHYRDGNARIHQVTYAAKSHTHVCRGFMC